MRLLRWRAGKGLRELRLGEGVLKRRRGCGLRTGNGQSDKRPQRSGRVPSRVVGRPSSSSFLSPVTANFQVPSRMSRYASR